MSFAKSCVTGGGPAAAGEGRGREMSTRGLYRILQSESCRSCRNLSLLDSIFYRNLGLLLLDCIIYGAAELFLTPCQEIGIWASFTTFSPFSNNFLIVQTWNPVLP